MRCTMLHYIHSLHFSLFRATRRPFNQANPDALWHPDIPKPTFGLVHVTGRGMPGWSMLAHTESLTCAPHGSAWPVHTHSFSALFLLPYLTVSQTTLIIFHKIRIFTTSSCFNFCNRVSSRNGEKPQNRSHILHFIKPYSFYPFMNSLFNRGLSIVVFFEHFALQALQIGFL